MNVYFLNHIWWETDKQQDQEQWKKDRRFSLGKQSKEKLQKSSLNCIETVGFCESH